MSLPSQPVTDQEFTSAIELLRQLIPQDEVAAYSFEQSPATVYTTLSTLWILTLQRLGGGQSLQAIVRETLANHREIFPNNTRVREGTLSENPSGYSKGRQRLLLATAERFCDSVSKTIIDRCAPTLRDRQVYVIDGTTIALSPTSELTKVYPPATNQFGRTVWPILMLSVAHELRSGAALRPEFGAKFGDDNTSEAEQAIALAKRIPRGSILLADSGYGIFQVSFRSVQLGHDFIFRLTNSRFKALARKAELVAQKGSVKHYRLEWQPSPKDRKNNPSLPADARLFVELHSKVDERGETLHVVTSLSIDSAKAIEVYGLRYSAVEHDLRDLKVTLNLEQMRARSKEMVEKEILCSVVAYNLVVQLRRTAAKIADLPPRRLSFVGCWNTMQSFLLHYVASDTTMWQSRYEQAVVMASRAVLPLRPGRSFPRKAHPQRPKTTNFHKTARKQPSEPNAEPPP